MTSARGFNLYRLRLEAAINMDHSYTNGALPSPEIVEATNPVLECALSLAKAGYYVFPAPLGTKKSHKSRRCSPEGKRRGATRSADVLQEYWAEYPDANLGNSDGYRQRILGAGNRHAGGTRR